MGKEGNMKDTGKGKEGEEGDEYVGEDGTGRRRWERRKMGKELDEKLWNEVEKRVGKEAQVVGEELKMEVCKELGK